MKNVFLFLIMAATIMFTSCKSGSNNEEALNGSHKVVVKEVIQANAYTYLNVIDNEVEQWIAVPKMEASVGETYYFDEFMDMKYFESKDLGRVFESVYFVQDLRTELKKEAAEMGMPEGHMSMDGHEGKPQIAKDEVKIESVEGGITIEELFSNREDYNGKKVIIRGKVVKYNPAIMNKNWIHIQDGTSFNGEFDLTVTSDESEIQVGEIITVEGTIILNKDFGYGYKYDVLMEDAVKK